MGEAVCGGWLIWERLSVWRLVNTGEAVCVEAGDYR